MPRPTAPPARPTSHVGVRPYETKKAALYKHVHELGDFSSALILLAEEAPDRMTMAQGVFFLLAATADIAGRPATFTSIKETVGDAVNRSLHSTYKTLLIPSRTFPHALGWLDRVENPSDNREKFLVLTTKGRKVIEGLIVALTGETQ